jgi:hypothetical protein
VPALARGFGFVQRLWYSGARVGGDLLDMIQWFSDDVASRCIAYLGFEWISAVLQQ